MSLKNFKNYLLIGLILTSVVQIGILWDFTLPRLPFNFLREFQRNVISASDSLKNIQGNLFRPKRIILSTGAYQSTWVVNKDGDTKDIYDAIWNDATIYISKIVADVGVENISTDDNKWSDIVTKKSVSVEFDTPLSQDMIGFFLNNTKVKNESGPDFVKLVVSPWENENYNTSTVYLLDSNNHVYKYNIKMDDKNLKKESYDSNIQKLTKLQDQQLIRNYMSFGESKIKMSYTIRPDMLVSAYGNKYDKLAQLNVSVPDNFHITEGTKLNDIEDKFSSILGGESDSYDIFKDTKGTVVLTNEDNMYKLYSSGILEYKKTGKYINEKGTKTEAFKNAIAFVEKLDIPSNVQVYLSNVEDGQDSYKFTFDYKVSELPLRFNVNLNNKSDEKISNAIVIESNADSTLSCRWVIRNIEVLKDKKNQYDVNSFDILNDTFAQYPEIKQSKDFSIEDVQVGYILPNDGTGTRVDPMGIVVEGKNKIYNVKLQLPVKKGD